MSSSTATAQHLTIREASAFSGKSVSTIKRLVREIVQNNDHPKRQLIRPSIEEIRQLRSAGHLFTWSIDETLLLKRFEKKTSSSGSLFSQATVDPRENSFAIIHVLRDQLQNKDRQIQTLEQQLDRKDDQIKGLNDRLHESNVLMRELQTRLAIAPARPKSAAEKPAQGLPDAKVKARNQQQKKRQPRNAFLSFLVGR